MFITQISTTSRWLLLLNIIAAGAQQIHADVRYEIHRGPISELHRKQLLPLRSTLDLF